MNKLAGVVALSALLSLPFGGTASGQDLGPQFRTVAPGIHVRSGNPIESNCTIIVTNEGIVLIDAGHNPTDSRAVMEAVKKLTPMGVRILINTEPHADHTSGHFVFSPPAVIVAAYGAGDSMRKAFLPRRFDNEKSQQGAIDGFRLVTPHVEFHNSMTLTVGERTFELRHMPRVHSESDAMIWLPKERVLFTAASISVGRYNNLRPFVSIPDTLKAIRMMQALNPEIVIPGHGAPGSVTLLNDTERYYTLLMERVQAMMKQGRTLEQIKAELRMPESESWAGKDRYPNNIEAAYRALSGG